MNIAIVGTGYVGLVTGTCFAEMGNDVTCVDVDVNKIARLQKGEIPIYEPGLDELVVKNVKAGRLHFTTKLEDCLDDVKIVFCAVGTPPDEDGSADLKYVLQVARTFAENINHYTVFTTKSTVPVGTADKVRHTIADILEQRFGTPEGYFDVASNPEFLKEGTAVSDFLTPERIVVGTNSEQARELMEQLYHPFTLNHNNLIFTDIPSAEMIKYAANSMLATRISFMNEIANLCDKVGANVDNVRKGIGSDSRIGKKFLYPGCGYGGSCFPKDVKALIKTGQKYGEPMKVLTAVEEANERQKHIPFVKTCAASIEQFSGGTLEKRTIAVWGLAFKPETDDMREATALSFIGDLKQVKCKNIRVYDPIAMNECKRRLGEDSITYCKDMYDAAKGADIIVLLTEWKEFRMIDWEKLNSVVKNKIIVDGRNLYDREEVQSNGYAYYAIGK